MDRGTDRNVILAVAVNSPNFPFAVNSLAVSMPVIIEMICIMLHADKMPLRYNLVNRHIRLGYNGSSLYHYNYPLHYSVDLATFIREIL